MKFFSKIFKKMRQNYPDIMVITIALVFFIFCAYFIKINQFSDYIRWSSPDETANYFFTNLFSQNEGLLYFDQAGIYSEGWTSPRSMRIDQGILKPVSFPGIILIFGSIASFFNANVIPFLGPAFASLGIIIFFYLIKKIFNKRIALLSSFLLSFFPVYIYYSVRSMFHNILFVVLCLASFYLLAISIKEKKNDKLSIFRKIKNIFSNFSDTINNFLQIPKRKKILDYIPVFFSGVFLGLAIITRTSEILWILPSFFIIYLFFAKRFNFTKLLVLASGLLLGFLPGLISNQFLYGSALHSGYNEMNVSIDEISQSGYSLKNIFQKENISELFNKLKDNIFYFGFKPKQSWQMFNAYVISMFPIIFWLALAGFLVFIVRNFKRLKKKHLVYFTVGAFFSLFLIVYYGSWLINDNPDLCQITIGNSYTRYWLPIYLWLIPMAGYFIFQFTSALFPAKYIKKELRLIFINSTQALIILLISINSLNFLLFHSSESLLNWKNNNYFDNQAAKIVLDETENNSIIITKYYDKLLFPQRRVIVATFPDNDLSNQVEKLVEYFPVYYYHFELPEKDINYLNERRLLENKLQIKKVKKINENLYLYQIIKVNKEIEEIEK